MTQGKGLTMYKAHAGATPVPPCKQGGLNLMATDGSMVMGHVFIFFHCCCLLFVHDHKDQWS